MPASLRARTNVLRSSLGEVDPARRKEGPDAVEPRLPVHESFVVTNRVERFERCSIACPLSKKLIEGLLPGSVVNRRSVGENSVKIEQPRLEGADRSEQISGHMVVVSPMSWLTNASML